MLKMVRCIPLVLAALMLLLPFGAQAQQPQNGGRAWARRGTPGRNGMAMLAQKLNLTDGQKQQFRQIARESRQQAVPVRNDNSLSDADKKAKLQQVRREAHQKMFAVLTPEQKEQLKQMREERKKQMEKNQGPGDQASGQKPGSSQDDDPFAGMTSDDDEPGNGK